MKTWWIGAALILVAQSLNLWPFPKTDAGKLWIAETLLISREEGRVVLTSQGIRGEGGTVTDAMEDLTAHTPGELFLRQTRRVIFCGGAETLLNPLELPEELPVGACVYRWSGDSAALDLAQLEPLLEAREQEHRPEENLASLENLVLSGRMPTLIPLEARDE